MKGVVVPTCNVSLEMLRQEDDWFKTSLCYVVSHSLSDIDKHP